MFVPFRIRTLAFALLAAACAASLGTRAQAAELIMFEQAGCVWCARFNREIAPIYPKTDSGKIAPLRRVDIYQPIPPDLTFIGRERFTPVFVLIDEGREIGRIRGYPGDANFWGLLDAMVERMVKAKTGNPLRTNG